jgi:hypothetical protein
VGRGWELEIGIPQSARHSPHPNTDLKRPLHAVLEVERVRGAYEDPARGRRVVAATAGAALLLLLARGALGRALHRRPPLEAQALDGVVNTTESGAAMTMLSSTCVGTAGLVAAEAEAEDEAMVCCCCC